MRLKNAVVLVTGASSGIGEATALAFARAHCRLALCARRLDRLQSVAQRCRSAGAAAVITKRADVGREGEALAFVAAALRDFEQVDVLVNNAGFGWSGRFEEMPLERARDMVETNLLGAVWCTHAVLPSMLAARRGVIINVASTAAFRPLPYRSLYAATKAGLAALSHGLRGELTGTGVKVSAVYPATTRTEFFSVSGGRMVGLVYPPSWVARMVVRTARWPRRDVVVLPYRGLQLLEPIAGGFMDHSLGEALRKLEPGLGR